jgi:Domain of Unknown Function (DUF1206)
MLTGIRRRRASRRQSRWHWTRPRLTPRKMSNRTANTTTKATASRAANSPALAILARAGLAARGVMYVLIGIIAVQIALGSSGQQADRTGAVRLVAATPFGSLLLWLLAIGFAALTLWQLSWAAWGSPDPDGHKPKTRLMALGKAVFYAVVAFSVFKYALGLGAPASSDQQSQDLTAKTLQAPGGQALVAIAGIVVAVVGCCLAWQAWQKRFAKKLRLSSASPRTRRVVLWLGQAGGIARGVVAVTAGVFLIVAAVDANPVQAKGVDSALRALAHTPLGPVLLILVALGLVTFGVYSWCEARWRNV